MRIREQLVTNENLQGFYMGFTINTWWQMRAYKCILWVLVIICCLMKTCACVFVSINGHLWNREHCKFVNIRNVLVIYKECTYWLSLTIDDCLHVQVIKMTISVVTMAGNGLYGHFKILKSNRHMHNDCLNTNGVYGSLETICGWNALG